MYHLHIYYIYTVYSVSINKNPLIRPTIRIDTNIYTNSLTYQVQRLVQSNSPLLYIYISQQFSPTWRSSAYFGEEDNDMELLVARVFVPFS